MFNMIKAIIFDLGNVWVDFDHMIAARRISQFSGRDPKEIFNLFFDSELTGSFEEGTISPDDFFSDIKKKLSLEISYPEFLPIWNEIFFLTDKNITVHNLAKLLKKNYTLALLSNINVLHFQYLKNKFPIFDIFNHTILSYQLHLRKPDRRIYEKTLQILNLKAQEVVYIDDRQELTDRANMLGIRSFYFQGVEKLRKDFLSTGINLEE